MIDMLIRVDSIEDQFYYVVFFAKQDMFLGKELTYEMNK